MNKVALTFVVLLLVAGGFLAFNSDLIRHEKTTEVVTVMPERDIHLNQFVDASIEIAFDYPDGPDGYTIDDLSAFIGEENQEIEVRKVYRIMNTKEKYELENSEGGREGPTAIQLLVFKNERNQSASRWVDAYPRFSNIDMVLGEVNRDAVVGGANAVRYTTDGLYLNENVVVASGGYIYHFVGSYLEPGSVIQQDYKAIIDSVRFIPPTDATNEVGAKIDVRVACESALAYTLFETGEQADQFVEDCVNGEHPDVIERYINDQGFDGDTV